MGFGGFCVSGVLRKVFNVFPDTLERFEFPLNPCAVPDANALEHVGQLLKDGCDVIRGVSQSRCHPSHGAPAAMFQVDRMGPLGKDWFLTLGLRLADQVDKKVEVGLQLRKLIIFPGLLCRYRRPASRQSLAGHVPCRMSYCLRCYSTKLGDGVRKAAIVKSKRAVVHDMVHRDDVDTAATGGIRDNQLQ